MSLNRMLSVADVAKLRRTGRVAAFRWLKRNARAFLKTENGDLRIAEADLAKVWEKFAIQGLLRTVAEHDEILREHDRRLDGHAEALRQSR